LLIKQTSLENSQGLESVYIIWGNKIQGKTVPKILGKEVNQNGNKENN